LGNYYGKEDTVLGDIHLYEKYYCRTEKYSSRASVKLKFIEFYQYVI